MKKLFQITATDQGGLQEAVLCMRIGTKHISTAIVDRRSRVIYNLCYYAGSRIDSQQLQAMFDDHPEFNRSYADVQVGYDGQTHVILPGDSRGPATQVLKTMHIPDEVPVLLQDNIANSELVNTYWMPAAVHEWVKERFPGAKFFHQHTVHYHVAGKHPQIGLFVDFRNDEFLVIASKEGVPVLIQVYEYSTPGDVLYYLLRVCEHMGYSQQEVAVMVSGLVDRQSGLFNALYQYFAHISFRLPEWEFPPGQHPAHFFTSLNDLALCGS